MHEAAKLKPVVIDESLVDYEILRLAREMGYSGVALKACKGQTDSLLLGAAAQKFKHVPLRAGSDLPGASFLQSAPGGPHPHRGGRRRQQPPILPASQQALGEKVSRPVQGHRRPGRPRAPATRSAWASEACSPPTRVRASAATGRSRKPRGQNRIAGYVPYSSRCRKK